MFCVTGSNRSLLSKDTNEEKRRGKSSHWSLFTLGFDRLKSCFRATVKCFIETLSHNLRPPDNLFVALLSSELKKM
ncbi:hypothetical protein Sarmat_00983 [Rickettsiales endosymbiont of Paramecium tredecaurelia]|nr:hypothetical protein [Candidatus Sarmatiella mevalonica]